MDRRGEADLLHRVPKFPLFLGIRDERGLDQHRRDVRRGQHDQAGVLDLALLQFADPVELGQDVGGRLAARADDRILRQVEQDGSQHVALVVQRHAADEVGCVLAIRQPPRRLVARPARGQHVDGRSAHGTIHEGIGVYGHEQVGLAVPRPLQAIAERDEVITGAGQHRAHPGLRVDLVGEQPRHLEGDVLLAGAGLADGARVLAAVAGIDGNHQVTLAGRGMRRDDRPQRTAAGGQIDDQPVAVGLVRRCQETVGLRPAVEVEHDPQGAARLGPGPHRTNQARGLGHGDAAGVERSPLEVDDDAIGTRQREQLVTHRLAQIEHHPGRVGTRPDAQVADLHRRGGYGLCRDGCEQDEEKWTHESQQAQPVIAGQFTALRP